MRTDAVILAGGMGTRLLPVIKDVPKPMADINGRPFLSYLLKYLKKYSNPETIIFSVGYKAESIKDFFGDKFEGYPVAYSFEREPLGTGGAIALALRQAKTEYVFVLNGDTFFKVDLGKMLEEHIRSKADVTICLRELPDVSRFGTIETNAEGRITSFKEKKGDKVSGKINGGIYIFRKDIFSSFDLPEKFSIEKDFFEKYSSQLKMFGFKSSDYFIDIGIPEEYARAQAEFKSMEF